MTQEEMIAKIAELEQQNQKMKERLDLIDWKKKAVHLYDDYSEKYPWMRWIFGEVDKVQTAIKRLQAFEPSEGYYLAFSGGKDSQCIYHLAKMAGVKFDAHYTITSVDPPELIRFIKKYYPDVSRDYPRDSQGKVITMWNLIPKNEMPPASHARYCCAELKETAGKGRITVTGVRWAESLRRKNLHGVANIKTKSKSLIDDALQTNPSASLNDRGG